MALVTCPKCGRQLDTAGAKPGTPLTCQCGNVLRAPSSKTGMWVVFAILGALGLCGCIGILAAIAIPNFLKFQQRAKQAECKANLRTALNAEQAYFAEHNAYTESIDELGFNPEPGNRYAYFFGTDGAVQERGPNAERVENAVGINVDRNKFPDAQSIPNSPVLFGVPYGVTGECPDCQVTIVCAGNVDQDDSLDLWVISSGEITDPDGRPIPAGTPHQLADDTTR